MRATRSERREQIVQALRDVMAERGYERATVQAIARRAGLAPGLVHYHFDGKDAILVELVGRLRRDVDDRFERLRGGGPEEQLRAWLDAHLAVDEDASPASVACWVALGAAAMHRDGVRTVVHQAMMAHRDQVLLLLEPFGLPAGDRERIASAVVALVEGAYRLAVLLPEGMPSGQAADWVWRDVAALLEPWR